jgi:hypothetical protein
MLNRNLIYDPSVVSERDMQFFSETKSPGYFPLRRIECNDMSNRAKWILADRKHFAQWKLHKIQKMRKIQERRNRLDKEKEWDKLQELEAMFWAEAPIMRPWQRAAWEKYNWDEFYIRHAISTIMPQTNAEKSEHNAISNKS